MTTDWLAQVQEAPLEPELPIIDPHHHLWERPNNVYLLDDLVADVSRHNVRQTVFIECTSMYRTDGPEELHVVGETEFVEGVANASAERIAAGSDEVRACTGIVGTADLTLGADVARVLEAHLEASPTRFRGIRHRAAWDADPALAARATSPEHVLMDPKFREGYAQLERFDLTFEGWLYHPQIAEITDLARAFPNTTIILNHLAGPLGVGPYAGKHDEIFEAWRPAITELAACENVVAKVGGIQMQVNGFGWDEQPLPPTSDQLLDTNRRWYEHTIEAFGPDRCMFESNFPVDKLCCDYTILWNQFKKLTANHSPTERAAMFHDTAAHVYRLETL